MNQDTEPCAVLCLNQAHGVRDILAVDLAQSTLDAVEQQFLPPGGTLGNEPGVSSQPVSSMHTAIGGCKLSTRLLRMHLYTWHDVRVVTTVCKGAYEQWRLLLTCTSAVRCCCTSLFSNIQLQVITPHAYPLPLLRTCVAHCCSNMFDAQCCNCDAGADVVRRCRRPGR